MDVIVVDDEPLARDRLARMVEKLPGYQVVGLAEDVDRAMRLIAEEDPDVVLLDVRMPEEDGLSAAKRITSMDDPPAVTSAPLMTSTQSMLSPPQRSATCSSP
jgi:two-component system response regulator AlgR